MAVGATPRWVLNALTRLTVRRRNAVKTLPVETQDRAEFYS